MSPHTVLDAPVDVLEDYLRVDLRGLRREAVYWRPGEFTRFALREGVLIGVDLRPHGLRHIMFAFRVEGRPCRQLRPLDLDPIGGRVRPRFVCAIEGPMEVLAFRGGRFAAAPAQRLIHRSQVRKCSS